jgi:hypothetical protein
MPGGFSKKKKKKIISGCSTDEYRTHWRLSYITLRITSINVSYKNQLELKIILLFEQQTSKWNKNHIFKKQVSILYHK